MKIILDANFLIYAARQKIDYVRLIYGLGEISILSCVVDELSRLKNKARKIKDRDAAGVALAMIESYAKEGEVKLIGVDEKNADKAIIDMATKKDMVATMDRELKRKLKGKTRILSIKDKKKLEIT